MKENRDKTRTNVAATPDWWNLDMAFGQFMYPRISKLIKNGSGYFGKSSRAWNAKLKKMAKAFKWLAQDRCSLDPTPKYVREGMTLFADNVEKLWD